MVNRATTIMLMLEAKLLIVESFQNTYYTPNIALNDMNRAMNKQNDNNDFAVFKHINSYLTSRA